jgi:hypothetical protein
LNVHNVSEFRQLEIHTAEPPVPGPNHPEVETAIEKLKRENSPGRDPILAELIQAGGERLVSALHSTYSLIPFGVRKSCLISGRSPVNVPIHKNGDKTD